jgi:hypothetical protein
VKPDAQITPVEISATATKTDAITYGVNVVNGTGGNTEAITIEFTGKVEELTPANIAIDTVEPNGGAATVVAEGVTEVASTNNWKVALNVTAGGAVKVTVVNVDGVAEVPVQVTLVKVEAPEPIDAEDFRAIGIAPYNEEPNGVATPADIPVNVSSVDFLASVTVSAAEGSKNQGTNTSAFDAGDTQVFTISVAPASGYTFVGSGLTANDIAAAFLGDKFTGYIASTGTLADPFVVTVTYTKPEPGLKVGVGITDLPTDKTITITKGGDTVTGNINVDLGDSVTLTATVDGEDTANVTAYVLVLDDGSGSYTIQGSGGTDSNEFTIDTKALGGAKTYRLTVFATVSSKEYSSEYVAFVVNGPVTAPEQEEN